MKCPHCEEEITGTRCTHCSRENPEEAGYCMYCGTLLGIDPEEEEISEPDFDEDDDDLDLANRVLCPDGACTGIIVNGRCTECRKRG